MFNRDDVGPQAKSSRYIFLPIRRTLNSFSCINKWKSVVSLMNSLVSASFNKAVLQYCIFIFLTLVRPRNREIGFVHHSAFIQLKMIYRGMFVWTRYALKVRLQNMIVFESHVCCMVSTIRIPLSIIYLISILILFWVCLCGQRKSRMVSSALALASLRRFRLSWFTWWKCTYRKRLIRAFVRTCTLSEHVILPTNLPLWHFLCFSDLPYQHFVPLSFPKKMRWRRRLLWDADDC